SDSPKGNPTSGISSCHAARPFQKSASDGGGARGVLDGVALANAAATGLGQRNVAVGVGVTEGVLVADEVSVGMGVPVAVPLVVGVAVVDAVAVGSGVGVMLGVSVGGRGVCVMKGSKAATCGGTTPRSERIRSAVAAKSAQPPPASRPSTIN